MNFRRRDPLPADQADKWLAFLDCAQVIESGRRVLLGTLPTGRVEPAPIAVGVASAEQGIRDARDWMHRWEPDMATAEDLWHEWAACGKALDTAEAACDQVRTTAADTDELEVLLDAVGLIIEPLDAFADAEKIWRRMWKIR